MALHCTQGEIALEERDTNQFWIILLSLLLHLVFIVAAIFITKMYTHAPEFRRPPTFTLVNFEPPLLAEMTSAKAPEPIVKATARPQAKASPVPAEQAQVQDAVIDVTDKNIVPSTEPVVNEQVTGTPGGSQTGKATSGTSGAIGEVGQPVAIGSVSALDNTSFAPIYNPKPAYPQIALKANIQGYADVELVVTPAGTIESFSIVNVFGHPSFGDETAKVIKRWRFPPPRIKGKPVKIKYEYRVNFSLD